MAGLDPQGALGWALGANGTNVATLGGDLKQISERTLWIGSRVAAVLVILLLLALAAAVCIYYRGYAKARGPAKRTTFRPYKCCHEVKQCLYDLCCCAWCCTSVQAAIVPEYMRPVAPQTLRVTLLRADKIRQRCSFYLEVSTEPADGWPKTSRVHHKAVGSCDLGAETLELDWYGDEEAVLIHAVAYSGKQVSSDRALAEVRLGRDAVRRYASEARGASAGDFAQGARLFTARPLPAQAARLRNQRFKGPSAIQPMIQPFLPGIIAALQEQGGGAGGGADAEESARLKEEVQRLRAENEALGGTLHRSAVGGAFSAAGDGAELPEATMRLALRFELVPSHQSATRSQVFKSPSFEESELSGNTSCC